MVVLPDPIQLGCAAERDPGCGVAASSTLGEGQASGRAAHGQPQALSGDERSTPLWFRWMGRGRLRLATDAVTSAAQEDVGLIAVCEGSRSSSGRISRNLPDERQVLVTVHASEAAASFHREVP